MKKANAWLALLTYLVLLVHVVYQVVSYIAFFYNPILTKTFAHVTMGLFVAHAILSLVILVRNHDAKPLEMEYKGINARTYMQRIFGILMCVLLPLHIFMMVILSKNVGTIFYNIEEVAIVLFFWALFTHVGLSLSNAFVTLGWLSDIKVKKVMDVVIFIICQILFAVTSFVIVLTYRKLLNG